MITDKEIDAASDRIFLDRIADHHGWLKESISECNDEDWVAIEKLVKAQNFDLLGKLIYTLVLENCSPNDDEIIAQAEYDHD